MKIKKRIKPGIVLALVALVFLPCLNLMQAHAANEVNLEQKCSLTISVDIGSADGSNAAWIEDFNEMTIPVSVYKVADVDATGQKFTVVDGFEGMEFSSISTDSATKAAEWQAKADEAAEILKKDADIAPAGETVVKAASEGQTASGRIDDLGVGMYLVVPSASYNTDYTVQYAFSPYLTALPSSEYTLSGAGSDAWVYDTTIGLKPEAIPQYGRLTITKTLENFNTSLGNVTFVFHITGSDPATGAVVYDEVESLTYSAAGNKEVILDNIPAGLTVTVTEEYSGASYVNSGAGSQTAVIPSDAAVEAGAGAAAVTFQNRYGGGNRGGYGVTNHFESNGTGGWTWEKQEISQPVQ